MTLRAFSSQPVSAVHHTLQHDIDTVYIYKVSSSVHTVLQITYLPSCLCNFTSHSFPLSLPPTVVDISKPSIVTDSLLLFQSIRVFGGALSQVGFGEINE